MRQLLLLLLCTATMYGQVPANATPLENIQITNNVQDNTATKVTVRTDLGVQNWLPMANLPISTATQTAIDAKVGDFINDNATTIAPSQNAVYDALTGKQLVFTGIDQAQFLTENDITIDNTALTLTIATVKNGTAISTNNPVIFYTDGNGVAVRHTKTAPVVFTFTNTTGVWYFYFDSSGNPIATQTSPADSSTIARVYRIYWNSTLAIADKRVIESLEVYKNDATWIDRDWKDTQGAQYSSGFTLTSNVIATGTPAIDGSNAVINLTSGIIIDSNLAYTLTNASAGTAKFTQNLGSGLLPATSGKFITITNNASLVLDKIPATDFPFLWNATTNTPEYLTQLGVRTGVTANNFFVYYLYAIQDPRRGETIKIKSAEIDFANSSLAEAHSWTQLQTLFPTLRDSKIRVLYKLTFEYKTAFDIGTKKSALRKIEDLRKQRTTSTATVGGVIPASTVSFTAAGNISSTNVQLALEELDAEKAPLASPVFTGQVAVGTGGYKADGNYVLTTTSTGLSAPNNGNITFYTNAPATPGWTSNAPITATSFIKSGGTSSQFLKADGSSDGTAYISGTLTSGYIPKTTGTNSLGNSLMFDNGTNVGVGTASPNSILTVGSTDATSVITPGGANTFLTLSGMGADGGLVFKAGGVANGSQGLEKMRITSAGNVGIGTVSPSGLLHLVSGSDMYFKMSRANGTFASQFYRNAGAGNLSWQSILSDNTTVHNYIQCGEADVSHASAKLIMQPDGGNVLIGTTTDDGVNKLQVNGSGYLTKKLELKYIAGSDSSIQLNRDGLVNWFMRNSESDGALIFGSNASDDKFNINFTTGVVKINNLSGTGIRTVVADASGNLSTIGVGYKVYTAYITQTGTNAPVATVFDNTLGGTVVWTRNSTGNYSGTLTGAFATGTYLNVSNTDPLANSGAFKNTSSEVKYSTTASGVLSDGVFVHLEIRVYN